MNRTGLFVALSLALVIGLVFGIYPELDLKLAALQCYQSQWENPDTAPWFPGGAYSTFLEWIA